MTVIDISEEAGVRYLHFGSEWVQGAMRIRRPFDLELAYTREMMTGLLMREHGWPRTILQIGLGAGSLAKYCYRHLPHAHLTVVEINAAVLACAHQYFKLPAENERFEMVIDDGVCFVEHAPQQWDMILVDGFDRHARAGKLDSAEFYLACRKHLSASGLMAVNLFSRSRSFKPGFGRITDAFDGRTLALPSCDSGNIIAFAAHGETIDTDLTQMRERAQTLKIQTGLNLLPTLARLKAANTLTKERLLL